MRAPRQLSDQLFEEFFTLLPCSATGTARSIATAVSSGARAGEMLSVRPIDLNVDELDDLRYWQGFSSPRPGPDLTGRVHVDHPGPG